MIGLKEQQGLFGLIGKQLKKTIECFVIGGSAMMYHGVKSSTKDIDVVLKSPEDAKTLLNVLKRLGFKEKSANILYLKKKNTPVLMQRGDERIDMFKRKIINFMLTDSIAGRADSVYEYGKLVVKVVSPEDIILLKCATERAGDRVDAAEIIKRFDVDWETVLGECKNQAQHNEPAVFLLLYDFLVELKEDLKADVPNKVIRELRQVCEKSIAETMKKKKSIKTVRYKKTKTLI